MPFYEYKVVPLPEKKPKVRGLKGAGLFSHGLQTLMNEQAQDGWEYLRAETLPDEERKGLMGGREEVTRNVLVFRRELYYEDATDAAPDDAPPLTLSQPLAQAQAQAQAQPVAQNQTAEPALQSSGEAPEWVNPTADADAAADMDSIYSGARTEGEPGMDDAPGLGDGATRPAVRRPLFGERKDPS